MIEETSDPEERVRWMLRNNPFAHVCAGLHLGRMKPEPKTGEFDAVLTVAVQPDSVDDAIRHRHIPLSYMNLDLINLTLAVDWTLAQLNRDRTVLVRSEGGRQRPALVIAATLLRIGATYVDATGCVRRADPSALTDFRYLNLLREMALQ